MPTQEEVNAMHRYFGVEYNNRAWELGTMERTAEQDREFLDVAHASKLHWQAIGPELNLMRGVLLLAHAHASVGLGQTALTYARECSDYFLSRETEEWEQAFTLMIHAQAAHAAGNTSEHIEQYRRAKEIVDSMPEGEDKRIVMATWVRIPQP